MSFTQDKISVFARNMGNLILETGEDSSVKVSVILGKDSFVFELIPIGNMVRLRTADIICSLLDIYNPYIEKDTPCDISLPIVYIDVRNETDEYRIASWLSPVLNGGYDKYGIRDELELVCRHFLTWRPQIARTAPGIKEQLTFVNIQPSLYICAINITQNNLGENTNFYFTADKEVFSDINITVEYYDLLNVRKDTATLCIKAGDKMSNIIFGRDAIIIDVDPNHDAKYKYMVEPSINSHRRIFAKIYFTMRAPAIILLCEKDTVNMLYRIDCSYDTIKNTVLQGGIEDEIIAYDIYGCPKNAETCDYPYAQRFIVTPRSSSHTYFFFQNTLGGFDTIIATGVVKSTASGELLTAINNHVETEISNAYVESWEVNTGYIASKQEKNFWHEFFRSINRYVMTSDGTYRKIIVEEYKAEYPLLQLGSFTFKYHYSEPDNGAYFQRIELNDFISGKI